MRGINFVVMVLSLLLNIVLVSNDFIFRNRYKFNKANNIIIDTIKIVEVQNGFVILNV